MGGRGEAKGGAIVPMYFAEATTRTMIIIGQRFYSSYAALVRMPHAYAPWCELAAV